MATTSLHEQRHLDGRAKRLRAKQNKSSPRVDFGGRRSTPR
jgi:hypothetical protein